MNKKNQKIRSKLIALREELLSTKKAENDATKVVELDQSSVGRLSRMDAMQQQAMSIELKRRNELELKKIAGALARIDSGDYGFCVACDEKISTGRLEFDPATPLCLECADGKL
ncbi:MAG: TraR/DksA family transcriptional regulator [Gammaproteobacteria bacterium]